MTEGAAATRALDQDIGDVHVPSLREKRALSTATELPPTRRLVVHHKHTNVVSQPDLSGSTHRSPPQKVSATMTIQDVSATPRALPECHEALGTSMLANFF